MADTKVRPIRVEGNLAYITLTQGRVAIIDAADAPLVEDRNWSFLKGYGDLEYAKTSRLSNQCLFLHRFLMQPGDGLVVDHVNRDGLDNRRANLRVATISENARNKKARVGGSSRYKGVAYVRKTGKWQACIDTGGNSIYLGQYDSENLAHAAYCGAARVAFGKFARLQ